MDKNNLRKILNLLSLFIICMISFLLIFPTIDNNIHDQNMILYFNADEGGIMDLIWSNFSGQKVERLQFDADYGLELVYLSDFIRAIISPFVEITPDILLFIIRCIHSFAWVGAIIALWMLVGNHFGKGWQQILAVSLLAVRPALPYVLNSSKPELLVLFLMIIGLDCALRILDRPENKYLIIALCCSSLAFVIKYSGLFLMPAIIAVVFFSKIYQNSKNNFGKRFFAFFAITRAYMLPSLIGIIIIILPLAAIFSYVRKSTGITFYEEFGILGTIMQKKLILVIWLFGILCIFLSLSVWVLNKRNNSCIKKNIKIFNDINSCAIICCSIFFFATLLFSLRWLIDPKNFILVYTQLGTSSVSSVSTVKAEGLLYSFFQNIVEKICALDVIIFFLFIFYICLEVYNIRQDLKNDLKRPFIYKRMVLLVFLIVPFIYMITMLRMAQHHMLPFFVAMTILAIQGLNMFISEYDAKRYKNAIVFLVCIVFSADLVLNGTTVLKERIRSYNQSKDVAFELAQWWRQNIPEKAIIVADHPTRVYIPPEYKYVKILRSYRSVAMKKDVVEELQQLVNEYHPQYIYYNLGRQGMPKEDKPWPSINEMLPDKKVRLVKTFESAGRSYKRYSDDKFVIYEIINNEW